MKDTIINLTPPIDGVQYGINNGEIKEGDWYIIETPIVQKPLRCIGFEKNGFIICHTQGGSDKSICKKILFSNNPKDQRFPYLRLPSKEQEVERLANEYSPIKIERKAFVKGFNANKGTYTQEQMELAIDYGNEYYRNHSKYPEQKHINSFLQSLQPTAKAVRVEMEEIVNMDYKPSFGGGSDGHYNPMYIQQIKVETSSEFEQGLVKALEVIY